MDFAHGERDKKLNKKNVPWYCNKLLEYAHDGLTLEYFLRAHYIRRSRWDKYVKKHPQLKEALLDAAERARGWAYNEVYIKGLRNGEINPAYFKLLVSQMGYSEVGTGGAGVDGQPPPTIIFKQAPPEPHQIPGAPSPLEKFQVDQTGELIPQPKKGNGGNGSHG